MASLFIGGIVNTPFGLSSITSIEKNQIVCKPLEWKLAQNQIPTFYLNPNDIKPIRNVSNVNSYTKKQFVMSNYGIGQLNKKRKSDGICEVSLVDWTLANGKNPTLYCKLDNIQKFNAGDRMITKETTIVKEDPRERIKKLITDAIASKEKATSLFKQEKFEEAKEEYIKAIQVTQYLGDDIDNDDRATLFEFTVPCHNNVALCCINLKKYEEGVLFAKNSLTMVKAMEARVPDSLVWQCLLKRGMTEEKVFIETKKKSLFLMGKGNLLKKNYEDAIVQLEEALSLIAGDQSKAADASKIRELLIQAKKYSKKESMKEKSTWSKAFEANKKLEDDSHEKVTSATSSPKPKDKPISQNGDKNGSNIFNIDMKKILSDITGKNNNNDDDDKNKIIKFDDSTYSWILGLVIISIGGLGFWAARFRFRKY